MGTYSVGDGPRGISVDSSNNIWVANAVSNNVTKLSSLGVSLETYSAGSAPYAFGDFTGFAFQHFVLGCITPVALKVQGKLEVKGTMKIK